MFKSKFFLFAAAVVLLAPVVIFAGTAAAAENSRLLSAEAWDEEAFTAAGLDELAASFETAELTEADFAAASFAEAESAWSAAPAAADAADVRNRSLGKVTAVSADSFTLDVRGTSVTFLYDAETRFRTPVGDASAADLAVGRWVGVAGRSDAGDSPLARLVILMPEDFDPQNANAERHLGEVSAIDLAANIVTVDTRNGEVHPFQVTDETIFKGSYTSLADIAVGDLVAVGGRKNADGTFTLRVIAPAPENAYERPLQVGGAVTAVDAANGLLTFETPNGDSLVVQVNADTEFHSQDGSVTGLADLTAGMLVRVRLQMQADGSRLALAVGAAPALPAFDTRVGGEISAINGSELTLEKRDGTQTTLVVTADTQFRGGPGSAASLADLAVGMRVGAGAVTQPDGSLAAAFIFTRTP